MSKPRYDWWPYVKGMIRRYPKLKARYDSLHTPAVTVAYSEHIGGGGADRTTETVALRELPKLAQIGYEAVAKAVEATRYLQDGDLRLKVIELFYWEKGYTMDGVALQIPVSTRIAWQWSSDFIHLVAGYMGCKDECLQ